MTISLLEVRSQGALLSLALEDSSMGYVVQEITGLDPVKAVLVSSSFAQQDGAQYQASRRETRNITIQLGLEPDWSVESPAVLLRRLYGFFMPKTPVGLRFYTPDGLEVDIQGRVETCENEKFSEDPVVDISILCFDPDFIDLNEVSVSGSSTSGTSPTSVISYPGTVDTGLEFNLLVNRTLGAFSIYLQTPDGTTKTLDFAASLVAGDVVTINTVTGNKFARLTRGGVSSSILFGVSPQSNWHELVPGSNNIRVYATGAAIPYTIDYTTRYGGL